jgi:hypothetical protein
VVKVSYEDMACFIGRYHDSQKVDVSWSKFKIRVTRVPRHTACYWLASWGGSLAYQTHLSSVRIMLFQSATRNHRPIDLPAKLSVASCCSCTVADRTVQGYYTKRLTPTLSSRIPFQNPTRSSPSPSPTSTHHLFRAIHSRTFKMKTIIVSQFNAWFWSVS